MAMIKYSEAINDALKIAMRQDESVICYGLGVPDPKRIFGTTSGLLEEFGSERVFDTPTSENAMTGIGIGASLNGIRPVMIHQRMDFFLLAMDQLVNNAAKWHYMFDGKMSVPIIIRLIVGCGWGQGPTHSQNLQAWLAHVPGLKVIMPATAKDAKGLLLSAIFDDNPVVCIEHRWLHNQLGEVPDGDWREPIGKAEVIRQGKDVTIVSMSYMTVEAIHVAEFMAEHGLSVEVVDLKTVNPLDWETIFESVKKTGSLLALDTAWETCSVAGEILARVSSECFEFLKNAPKRIALPDFPTPTSRMMTRAYYKRSENIVETLASMFKIKIDSSPLIEARGEFWDVPGDWFKGPF